MSPGLFFSQKFQNVCAGLFFLRSDPKIAKIFWRFAPKHGDFAFKYDQKCPKNFRRFAPKYSDFAFKYDQKCSIFFWRFAPKLSDFTFKYGRKCPKIFGASRRTDFWLRGYFFLQSVHFLSAGLFFLKNLPNVTKI